MGPEDHSFSLFSQEQSLIHFDVCVFHENVLVLSSTHRGKLLMCKSLALISGVLFHTYAIRAVRKMNNDERVWKAFSVLCMAHLSLCIARVFSTIIPPTLLIRLSDFSRIGAQWNSSLWKLYCLKLHFLPSKPTILLIMSLFNVYHRQVFITVSVFQHPRALFPFQNSRFSAPCGSAYQLHPFQCHLQTPSHIQVLLTQQSKPSSPRLTDPAQQQRHPARYLISSGKLYPQQILLRSSEGEYFRGKALWNVRWGKKYISWSLGEITLISPMAHLSN